MRQPEVHTLAARGLAAADVREVAERAGALRIEAVAAVHVEFRVDGVQDARAKDVAIERRGGLQEIVLSRGARQVWRGNEGEQPLHGGVVCELARGDLLAAGTGGGKRSGRKRLENRRAAEQAAPLSDRWHRGKCVDRILGGIVLIVDEEICLVAAVVDMRNIQRAADGTAHAFVVAVDLGRIRSGDRKRFRVERGVRVAVEYRESDAIDLLAKQSAYGCAVEGAAATTDPPNPPPPPNTPPCWPNPPTPPPGPPGPCPPGPPGPNPPADCAKPANPPGPPKPPAERPWPTVPCSKNESEEEPPPDEAARLGCAPAFGPTEASSPCPLAASPVRSVC